MNGLLSSSGRCGLSRSSMNKSDLSSFSTKPPGSEPKKSMSLSVRWPAKPMSLSATGCKVCSRRGSRAEQEQLAKHCQDMRQLIVDLHFELPTMSWREIAEI